MNIHARIGSATVQGLVLRSRGTCPDHRDTGWGYQVHHLQLHGWARTAVVEVVCHEHAPLVGHVVDADQEDARHEEQQTRECERVHSIRMLLNALHAAEANVLVRVIDDLVSEQSPLGARLTGSTTIAQLHVARRRHPPNHDHRQARRALGVILEARLICLLVGGGTYEYDVGIRTSGTTPSPCLRHLSAASRVQTPFISLLQPLLV
eukprot:CAMPEP_0119410608 /NCGR_PEP_ID=MMETSP1335-20130426/3580_1 /TAXON_ID=259385 /ORGANISM="Chrysoculter rhomboideus, Strain RCC1486" /LENGTH=206 /DNA_ID=CAMNT_0007435159 /DNA_START=236 /DNA_END=857 /DNA_ORIENTATION=-